jgi:hypothetical protein
MNVEGKENFIISACGGFDIRYSSWEIWIGTRIFVSSLCYLFTDT